MKHVRYSIGNGEGVRFFHYPWCGVPFSKEAWGERLHYDLGVPWDTKVSYFIRNGEWNLPFPRTSTMEELWGKIKHVKIRGGEDQPERIQGKGDNLGMKEAWGWVKTPGVKVGWFGMVWHKYAIPKHSITTWKAMRGRLVTKRFMNTRGARIDPICPLCEEMQEDVEHLFWDCKYTKEVWGWILSIMGITKRIAQNLEEEVARIMHMRGSRVERIMRRWAFNATVYETWQERNRRVFEGDKRNPTMVVKDIKETLRGMEDKVKCLSRDDGDTNRFREMWVT